MGGPVAPPGTEVLIDLGERHGMVGDEADAPPSPPSPRWLVLAVLAVLAATSLVGDAAPGRLLTLLALPVATGEFDVAGDVLFLNSGPYAPNSITAYALGDGRRLWESRSATTGSTEGARRVGDRTVLVPDDCSADGPVATIALDTASGRQAWRWPGVLVEVVAGGRLVIVAGPGQAQRCAMPYPPIDAPPVHWDAVDIRTGRSAWSLDVPAAARVSFDGVDETGSRRATFVDPAGHVVSRDLTTGAVLGTVTLPALAGAGDPTGDVGAPPNPPELVLVGGRALLMRESGPTLDNQSVAADITAYAARGLNRLWSTHVDLGRLAGPVDDSAFWAATCGSSTICLYGPSATVLLDAATGRERWRTTLNPLAIDGDRGLFGDPQRTDTPAVPGALTIRDLRTGRVVADLPGWRPLSGTRNATGLPVLAMSANGRTWLARVDLADGRAAVVGSAPGVYYACVQAGAYLVARRIDGALRVWRTVSG